MLPLLMLLILMLLILMLLILMLLILKRSLLMPPAVGSQEASRAQIPHLYIIG